MRERQSGRQNRHDKLPSPRFLHPRNGRKRLPLRPSGAPTNRRRSWHVQPTAPTSPAFEVTSKRRKGFPSETRVKRGLRVVHGDVELLEKLGRNDPCPCESGGRFQGMLHALGPVSTGRSGTTIGGNDCVGRGTSGVWRSTRLGCRRMCWRQGGRAGRPRLQAWRRHAARVLSRPATGLMRRRHGAAGALGCRRWRGAVEDT